MTSLKPLPELNSKKSTLIFSKRPLSHSNSLLKVLMLKRLILMKLSWSVVQQESQKSDNWLNNSSMVKNPTQVSILMRLFAMVLPFKVVSFADKTLKMEELSSLMLPHFLLVLKLSVVLWAKSFQKVHTFQPRNLKSSQLIKIIKKQSQFKFSKVKDH